MVLEPATTSENNSVTSQPSARKMPGADAPGMPLPESTTIFIGGGQLAITHDALGVLRQDIQFRDTTRTAGVIFSLKAAPRRPWMSSP